MSRNHIDLKILKDAHYLTLDLYQITKDFPKEETYGLTQQIRRAAASIGANIAEGCGQNTYLSTRRYLTIAYASIKELEYHLLLAKDLDYLVFEAYASLFDKLSILSKMTYSFIANMPNNTYYPKPHTSNPSN
jgi:four helix bundle protein